MPWPEPESSRHESAHPQALGPDNPKLAEAAWDLAVAVGRCRLFAFNPPTVDRPLTIPVIATDAALRPVHTAAVRHTRSLDELPDRLLEATTSLEQHELAIEILTRRVELGCAGSRRRREERRPRHSASSHRHGVPSTERRRGSRSEGGSGGHDPRAQFAAQMASSLRNLADKIKRRLLKSQTLESRLAERDPSGWGIGWPADWQDADLSDLQVEADSAWTPLALRFVSLLREQPLESCHTTSPKTVSLAEPDGRTIGGRECTPRVRLEQ